MNSGQGLRHAAPTAALLPLSLDGSRAASLETPAAFPLYKEALS